MSGRPRAKQVIGMNRNRCSTSADIRMLRRRFNLSCARSCDQHLQTVVDLQAIGKAERTRDAHRKLTRAFTRSPLPQRAPPHDQRHRQHSLARRPIEPVQPLHQHLHRRRSHVLRRVRDHRQERIQQRRRLDVAESGQRHVPRSVESMAPQRLHHPHRHIVGRRHQCLGQRALGQQTRDDLVSAAQVVASQMHVGG